mgnify:CR=1 FL=1
MFKAFYLVSSLLFHLRFLLLHLRHFSAEAGFLAPHFLQTFTKSRCFCAIWSFSGSWIGMLAQLQCMVFLQDSSALL